MEREMDQGQYGFFFVQAKDIATFLVALLGFLIAFTNLRASYLRKARVNCQLSDFLRLEMSDSKKVRFTCDVILFNKGAEPALIDNLQIILRNMGRTGASSSHLFFPWRELRKTVQVQEPIAPTSGPPRKRMSQFERFAGALIVPKSDALVQEVFFGDEYVIPGQYEIIVEGVILNSRRRITTGRRPRFRSNMRYITFTDKNLKQFEDNVVRDDAGHYAYSRHVDFKLRGQDYASN
jgi:hypothetical protein